MVSHPCDIGLSYSAKQTVLMSVKILSPRQTVLTIYYPDEYKTKCIQVNYTTPIDISFMRYYNNLCTNNHDLIIYCSFLYNISKYAALQNAQN